MISIIAWLMFCCMVWGFCDLAWIGSGLIVKAIDAMKERIKK